MTVCGHRLSVVLAFAIGGLTANELAGQPALPGLLPPRGELPPSYWEQHGAAIVLVSLLVLAVLALLIFWLSRPAPAVVIPPGLVARRALEALRGQPEDGALLMRVSGILRSYIMFACGLPPRERTTTELSRELETHPQLPRELAGSVTGFLRQCDELKFSPAPPPKAASAVDAALDLVSRVEAQPIRRAVPPQPPAHGVAAAPS